MMKQEEFYKKCADIVGVTSEFKDSTPMERYDRNTGETFTPPTRATRWGGREPGNGRFPGIGLIRVFGPTCIHVNLREPRLNGTFDSYEAALDALREAFKT